jgi:hypothetical protein
MQPSWLEGIEYIIVIMSNMGFTFNVVVASLVNFLMFPATLFSDIDLMSSLYQG